VTIEEATCLAQKVLEEERNSPTVRYMLRESVASAVAPAALALAERGRHPRTVQERPGIHRFTSEIYAMLSECYAELADHDKSRFVAMLSLRISEGRAYQNRPNNVRGAGSWLNCTSELPLIAEFLVRHGQAQTLLSVLPKAPIRPGLTLLLTQIER
jgi:hypothetical protein